MLRPTHAHLGDAGAGAGDGELRHPGSPSGSGERVVSREGQREAAVPGLIRISPDHEQQLDRVVRDAVAASETPGCVVVLGRRDGILFRRAYGHRVYQGSAHEERAEQGSADGAGGDAGAAEAMTIDTIFDVASVTKAVVTATAIMILAERGQLALDDPVSRYVPEFAANGKAAVTIRQLLLHIGGLDAANGLVEYRDGAASALAAIWARPLAYPPGEGYRYSDLGYIALGEVVARVSGRPLDRFVRAEIFAPLAMRDSGFTPDAAQVARIAPTGRRRAGARRVPGVPEQPGGGTLIRGVVHDPRAYRLGGVAGHAGLFSTADDLARYARALLLGGEFDGARVLTPETVSAMIAGEQVASDRRRALGWDAEPPVGLSARAIGHGGFTGAALWIDPELDLFVVFLSNRVYPNGEPGRVSSVRGVIDALIAIAAQAAVETPPAHRGAQVLTGIDVLRREQYRLLRGARVGLITNTSARARDGQSSAALLAQAPGLELVALFAPEHGLSADREGRIHDDRDTTTGLRVHSLFTGDRRPSADSLADIDTLVFDIQDVGARFYTYASTMLRAMEAAAAHDLRFVVLDRPNPIGATAPAGPVLEPSLSSFVNYHPMPVQHGMTIGELARLLNAERGVGAKLEVVPVEGWARGMLWSETGLRWVPPSPNLRTPEQALLYPATGLVEATNVSVGRGTDTPFEVVGAPWIDGDALAAALAGLPGVEVQPTRFVPSSGPHRGQLCHGVRFTLHDPHAFQPVRAGLTLARSLSRLHAPVWQHRRLAGMIGSHAVVAMLRAGRELDAIEAHYAAGLAEFAETRRRYLLYSP